MSQVDLLAPASLPEALELLALVPERAGLETVVLAGGTDLWPKWNAGVPRPSRVLSLHRLDELRQIERQGDLLRIGAACTHARLASSPAVLRCCPALAEAAAAIGAVQVQNRGTIGGNVVNASPAADLPPVLLAAGASVELASHARGRRALPLGDLYRGYRLVDLAADELLVALLIPVLPAGALERFRKIGTRRAQAISKVCGACRIELDSAGAIVRAGIAFGSVAATVQPLRPLENWLRGRLPAEPLAREAAAHAESLVQPIDDLRSTAAYRRHIVGQLVHDWLVEAAAVSARRSASAK